LENIFGLLENHSHSSPHFSIIGYFDTTSTMKFSFGALLIGCLSRTKTAVEGEFIMLDGATTFEME
jgi:hypothetical protein